MNSLTRQLAGFLVTALFVGFLYLAPTAHAQTATTTQEQGFTAVAGTEVAVQDKRKNNTTLVSGFALAFMALVLVGAVAHARRKLN